MKTKINLFLCLFFLFPFFSYGQGKDTTLNRNPPTTQSPPASSGGSVKPKSGEAGVGTPTRAVQDLELKTEKYKTGTNLTAEDRAKNAQIKREAMTGTFDLRELCRLALNKHWDEITPQQQNEFVNLMTQLLETKAILSKEQSKTQGKSYFVKYLGDSYLDPQKTKATTRTQITIPKENVKIAINYKLVKTAAGWKVFDVIVDEASLVENYKYQFHSIITKYGYPELVNRMKKKLTEIEKS